MTDKNLPATTDSLAGEFLKKFEPTLKNYAMRNYDHTLFLKSAMLAISDSNQLAECLRTDQGKKSLFHALRYAATTGLSLNPQEGKSALIGFKNKSGEMIINYQIMKNGLIDLALDSGKIEFINAEYVKENDKFSVCKTITGDNFTFEPALKGRGEIIGFYAALKLRDGVSYVKWLTVDEVKEFRDKYSATYKYKPDDSPWTKSFIGMGIKTVLKALLRSVKISDAIEIATKKDDYFEPEFHTHGSSADDALEKLKEEKPTMKLGDNGGDLL